MRTPTSALHRTQCERHQWHGPLQVNQSLKVAEETARKIESASQAYRSCSVSGSGLLGCFAGQGLSLLLSPAQSVAGAFGQEASLSCLQPLLP